jgi:hypothetical protein
VFSKEGLGKKNRLFFRLVFHLRQWSGVIGDGTVYQTKGICHVSVDSSLLSLRNALPTIAPHYSSISSGKKMISYSRHSSEDILETRRTVCKDCCVIERQFLDSDREMLLL